MKTIPTIVCSCLVSFSLQACTTVPNAGVVQSRQDNVSQVTIKRPVYRSVDAPPNLCQVGGGKVQPIGSPNTGADTGQVISPEEPEGQTSALVVELLKEVVVPVAIAVISK